jgi:hypothetical protein
LLELKDRSTCEHHLLLEALNACVADCAESALFDQVDDSRLNLAPSVDHLNRQTTG